MVKAAGVFGRIFLGHGFKSQTCHKDFSYVFLTHDLWRSFAHLPHHCEQKWTYIIYNFSNETFMIHIVSEM